MTMISTGDLNRKTPRELAAMKHELMKAFGACEQQKRSCQVGLAKVRAAQTRRIMRPNL
jgi:hypothetical protein